MTNDESDILINACRKGDKKAQLTLYKQYAKAMYNSALRILQQQDKAEDAVQEAFIKAFTNLDKYRAESSFGSWLKRIVINEALVMLRKDKSFISMEDFQHNNDWIDENSQEIWDFQENEVKILLEALNNLPEKQRIILSLSLIEGYDNQEIEQILQISNENCRTTLSRAKKSLKEMIKNIKNERKYF